MRRHYSGRSWSAHLARASSLSHYSCFVVEAATLLPVPHNTYVYRVFHHFVSVKMDFVFVPVHLAHFSDYYHILSSFATLKAVAILASTTYFL